MKHNHIMKISVIAVAAICGCNIGMANPVTSELKFASNDSTLQRAFDWAKPVALSYSHGDEDPVGPWCEAALPQREAFCIRDVCHQSVGAHLLGLTAQNRNMMDKFVGNISEGRDLCTYWELDRHDRPAPIDYRNDKEFWYNLNANFDIIHTAWKLYNWTGDADYINGDDYVKFYDISLDGYLDRWSMRPDNIMERTRIMNRPEDVEPGTQFYACRGIPSYVESEGDICVGLDLVATIYAGHRAAAKMAQVNGDKSRAKELNGVAEEYRDLVDSKWWNEEANRYDTSWTESGNFSYGEGIPFAVWFGIAEDKARRDGCIASMLSREWNIENISYFPAILLDNGYADEAYRLIGEIPAMSRSEYPEVSFGMIEAIIRGGMGIAPDASKRALTTEYRFGNMECDMTVENVPLFDGNITLTHSGSKSSTLVNNTSYTIKWTPVFNGEKGKTRKVKPGKTVTARA